MCVQKVLDLKDFGSNKICVHFVSEEFWVQKNLGPKSFLSKNSGPRPGNETNIPFPAKKINFELQGENVRHYVIEYF